MLQFVSSLMMTGVIWVVQLVHYPAFIYVEDDKFTHFERFHSQRISFIVMPLMIIELVTAAIILYNATTSGDRIFWGCNLMAIVAIWLSTFALSVPCHTRLSRGFDAKVIGKLVATNIPRTCLWTSKSLALMFWLLD